MGKAQLRHAVLIGTAGWSLPRAEQPFFAGEGSHLMRYAARFPVAEINSSFHRPHRPATYARWRESVPGSFRFSVKIPKAITHGLKLQEAAEPLGVFLEECGGLGEKLGCLLVQLPPSLEFAPAVADAFFRLLAQRTAVPAVVEPRHASWFTEAADRLLVQHRVARVAADPARVPVAAKPGGWTGLAYYRLHGSPKVYYSSYPGEYLRELSAQLRVEAARRPVWCIFDNTTLGAATANARELLEDLSADPSA